MKRFALLGLTAFLPVMFLSCADNPAADAPAAEVQEPAPATEPAPASATAASYEFAPESKVDFVGSKVTGSHDGGFERLDGAVTLSGSTPETATVNVTIDTTSLWSDAEKLTEHLKSADFFDVENHPTATFTSSSIASAADGGYTITGELTLRGVTKQISFPAQIELGADGFRAQAEFSIMRFDFGIEFKGAADNLIRDEVLIKLDLASAPAV